LGVTILAVDLLAYAKALVGGEDIYPSTPTRI